MSNISENLQRILGTLVEDHYINEVIYQRDAKANVEIKGRNLPVVELRSISEYVYNLTQDMVYETARCNLLFLEKQPKLDYDEAENDTRVNRMEWAARQFVAMVNCSDEIQFKDTNINVQTVFDRYDANTTGVNLQCNIVVKTPTCLATYVRRPITPFLWGDDRIVLFGDSLQVCYGEVSGVVVRDSWLSGDRDVLYYNDGQRMTLNNVDGDVMQRI